MSAASGPPTNNSNSHARIDENVASILVGWCLALIVLISYRICEKRRLSIFVWLCIALLALSATLAGVSWFCQMGQIASGRNSNLLFVVLWSLQAQVYFQIVPFRICVLGLAHPRIFRGLLVMMLLGVNITMLVLWPAAEWDPSENRLAFWLPRVEKVIYLLMDVALNILFLVTVKSKLVDVGLGKYRKLITYNLKIIGLSILCDAILLASMWYPMNSSLFILVHPVVYLNKLVLERAIAAKMVSVSKEDIQWTKPISFATVLKRASVRLTRVMEELEEANVVEDEKTEVSAATAVVFADRGRRGAFSMQASPRYQLDKALPLRPLEPISV